MSRLLQKEEKLLSRQSLEKFFQWRDDNCRTQGYYSVDNQYISALSDKLTIAETRNITESSTDKSIYWWPDSLRAKKYYWVNNHHTIFFTDEPTITEIRKMSTITRQKRFATSWPA